MTKMNGKTANGGWGSRDGRGCGNMVRVISRWKHQIVFKKSEQVHTRV